MIGGSSSNNNDNQNNERSREVIREKMKRRIEDSRTFREIIQKLMIQMQTSPRFQENAVIQDYQQHEYATERQVLLSINGMGLPESVAVGILTFLFLRRGPKLIIGITKRFSDNRSSSSGGYQLDRFHRRTTGTNNNTHKNERTATSAIFGGMKLGLDVFVSMLMAANSSSYLMNKRQAAEKIITLPLLEGKSIVCDEFCSTIQEEVAKRDPELWTTTEDFLLKQLHLFSKNCKRRKAYEQNLREEQGLQASSAVVIPIGGVPQDFFVPDDGLDNNNTGENDFPIVSSDAYDFENNDDSMTSFGDDDKTSQQQWGERMVTDQEKQQK